MVKEIRDREIDYLLPQLQIYGGRQYINPARLPDMSHFGLM
jgi:hypothetical protein